MREIKAHCKFCDRVTVQVEAEFTTQATPEYICRGCGKRISTPGDGAALGIGLGGGLFALLCVAFLAVNSVLLLPALLIRPWALAGSVLLVGWLWRRDNLRAEPLLIRYGVSAFLILWMGLFIAGVISELYSLHLLGLAKEMLFITLPGVALGFLTTLFIPRCQGRLWPVFVGICLAHTIGKATILGWIMGVF